MKAEVGKVEDDNKTVMMMFETKERWRVVLPRLLVEGGTRCCRWRSCRRGDEISSLISSTRGVSGREERGARCHDDEIGGASRSTKVGGRRPFGDVGELVGVLARRRGMVEEMMKIICGLLFTDQYIF